ncbi:MULTISPECIES: UDP-N-acetylmuramoyl-L-alanine--D-glutamate ligase [unclassified Planococcus (in: firmicutes)]|uniref:UDP-N-acetylmuramoyl-L-alanine--D-glutamate ligase n=1 Tax=Planococcus TaxID=1372 RepID=UPI000C347E73|nr:MULTISPECIES: UDP-N-acetylmuramoyl-L-alanine--D-glutamate ligase [unclassified Planococcus (in: firmicutes)]AUD14163.1 UDP-N-acetylmuramoyl-L-alanine--D-glutamate ligase [Planococcus sp. MB-3u-03]PKG48186.1 UDP-N-acetylmuramoyl-L-alanine--D-glutamate ligase [Planococcus sp. Urea-trap-24]PKG92034.1 UDP-N-acetylmuramoyl-L-alanine--D-glutamate ligase [Planococcus sp. Urea-3u-39]PKH43062.1 UDP-N-acetylmuramoyl-L-alanine--D-glutamate ligase [Planococcus sp. MB-3u-09]
MKDLPQLHQKKVLVLGLAKSGFTAARLLHKLGAFVTVNDSKPFEENPEAQELLNLGVTVICGRHPEDLLDEGFELVIKNPGIPYRNHLIQKALEKDIPVWTEIELAYRISEAPFIGITGSNGKTTTTTLLFHMLNQDGKSPLIAGNIGTVASGVAEKATADHVIVTELSSFQLKGTESFRPHISIITNLYEAHLDYHGSLEDYIGSKKKITENQTAEDYFIYNADQQMLVDHAKTVKAQGIPFTLKDRTEESISADSEYIYWQGEPLIERKRIMLAGEHNLENILSATAAMLLSGGTKETIIRVLTSFTGVKHRSQFVGEWQGRRFYNDSKATNELATKSALEAFNDNIILLAGGLERQHSLEELRPYMDRVKVLVTFGETADRFAEFAESCHVPTVIKAGLMDDAVEKAVSSSSPEDTILLSPACASWDQYESFEVRGDAFIEAARKYTEANE